VVTMDTKLVRERLLADPNGRSRLITITSWAEDFE